MMVPRTKMGLVILFALVVFPRHGEGQSFATARAKMVDQQLRAQGIRSAAVLHAMGVVERHRFVPSINRQYAYENTPLPIGEGQTISQPYIVAFMTEALKLTPSDRVLEIGTGSGYQAAILSMLCADVFTIELIPVLGNRADSLLEALGYKNVHVRVGDGYQGWPEEALFDAIIVTCSPSHIPRPLEEQLKEGGRMIIPVGDKSTQELIYLIKKNGRLRRQARMPVLFVPMKDSVGKRY